MTRWRNSKHYRRWRCEIIRRDVKCVVCGSMRHRHAHHIKDASSYPRLRYQLYNGVTLCKKCHVHLHTTFKRSYRCKTSEQDLLDFITLYKYARFND